MVTMENCHFLGLFDPFCDSISEKTINHPELELGTHKHNG